MRITVVSEGPVGLLFSDSWKRRRPGHPVATPQQNAKLGPSRRRATPHNNAGRHAVRRRVVRARQSIEHAPLPHAEATTRFRVTQNA